MRKQHILIGHGSGGKLSRDLIHSIFIKHFGNNVLRQLSDSAVLPDYNGKISYTTDSYVIDPIFFPGGDIGKLAISGTVNDLLVSGAIPKYLSTGFIIEEGFEIEKLDKIAASMAEESHRADISIVTGDTKVVKRGQCDKLFINTSGIGILPKERMGISTGEYIEPGDKILVTGSLGDHAIAILSAREKLPLEEEIISDVAPLNKLMSALFGASDNVRFTRDITRGGLATVLVELCESRNFGIHIKENSIPIKNAVAATCELYGFDPLYLANEGKILAVIKSEDANNVLEALHKEKLGKDASIIGEITDSDPGKTIVESSIGGNRIIDMLSGEMLPRIC